MSWKNIKEHYRIGHIVQIREGRICIGSGYVSDLITVSFDGEVALGKLGISGNEDLQRYHAEMTADLGKLKELIDTPDTFTASLPVYTYEDGEILEKQCEALGYPNITHDGLIQYGNTFSADKAEVVEWAKKNARYGIEAGDRRREEVKAEAAKVEEWRAEYVDALAKLNADYPDTLPEGLPNAGRVAHADEKQSNDTKAP